MNGKIYTLLLFCCLLLGSFTIAEAQSAFTKRRTFSKLPDERGVVLAVGGGLAAVRSNICGGPDCNRFGPYVSMGARYNLTSYLGISGSLNYLRLGATDAGMTNPPDISFRSNVIEMTGSLLVNLIDSYAGGGGYRSLHRRFLVPYIRVGAGLIYYSPTSYPGQGKLNETQVTYEPERKYPAFAAVVPFGGGLRFYVSEQISIAPELIYHITTTTHLDNIGSEHWGNSRRSDHYGVAAVKVLYTPVLRNKLFFRR